MKSVLSVGWERFLQVSVIAGFVVDMMVLVPLFIGAMQPSMPSGNGDASIHDPDILGPDINMSLFTDWPWVWITGTILFYIIASYVVLTFMHSSDEVNAAVKFKFSLMLSAVLLLAMLWLLYVWFSSQPESPSGLILIIAVFSVTIWYGMITNTHSRVRKMPEKTLMALSAAPFVLVVPFLFVLPIGFVESAADVMDTFAFFCWLPFVLPILFGFALYRWNNDMLLEEHDFRWK